MNTIHNQSALDISIFNRIDINLYPLFIAIFELKNISKSAQSLYLSQSAASHALQRLRVQLNNELFIRNGHQMLPTPFAEQIYPIIKNALISIQSIAVQNFAFDPSHIQNLKIAIHDEIEPLIFPKLIQHFQKLKLNIQLISIKLDRLKIKDTLASQQIDFVIDIEQNYGDDIEFKNLVHDQFVLCTQQSNVDQNQYLSSPHLGVSSRRTGTLIEDVYLQRMNLSRNISLRCQHYSTAIQILALQPDSLLTIPHSILSNLDVPKSIHILELPISLPQMNIGLFWYSNLNENTRHKFLKKEIIHIFA